MLQIRLVLCSTLSDINSVMIKDDNNFINKIVSEILTGIRDGLHKFSGPSSVAVIYQLSDKDELHICDPQSLLRGHESKIRSTYFNDDAGQFMVKHQLVNRPFSHINSVNNLMLDGIISFGGHSAPVFYQMWFTEHHPELLSTLPTERWLEHAVLRFSHDAANSQDLYTGISGRFLREYGSHAVHDQIQNEQNRFANGTSKLEIYPILNAVLGISKIREERQSPHGELVFIDPINIKSIDFLAQFRHSEQPLLDNFKHVRKLLLSVQNFHYKLVSDGVQILGVARGRIECFNICADFRGLFGFLRLNDQYLCSFADGAYSSKAHQAKLFEVEEVLLDYQIDSRIRNSLFHIVSSIVHYAETERFGCAIVLDMNTPLTSIAGQNLEQSLDLERSNLLDLACDLARVDGALQIGIDRQLHCFACLLDGPSISGEDRSRGARYNSALRFTAQHHHTMIVVVSSDRPVSVIHRGIEHNASCVLHRTDSDVIEPQLLSQWLDVV
jgi:hypothetical protein